MSLPFVRFSSNKNLHLRDLWQLRAFWPLVPAEVLTNFGGGDLSTPWCTFGLVPSKHRHLYTNMVGNKHYHMLALVGSHTRRHPSRDSWALLLSRQCRESCLCAANSPGSNHISISVLAPGSRIVEALAQIPVSNIAKVSALTQEWHRRGSCLYRTLPGACIVDGLKATPGTEHCRWRDSLSRERRRRGYDVDSQE